MAGVRALVVVAIGLSLISTGCRRQAPRPQEPVRVLTPVYAIADLVRQIGAHRVNVEWLIESGQPLDPIAPTPERRQQWNAAALVVTRGQVDPWTIQGAGNVYEDRRILRVDTLFTARASDPGHYLWLDPRVAMELADEATERLTGLRAEDDFLFKTNRDTFIRETATLMEEAVTHFNRAGGGAFVSLDRGFQPLARRFGLTVISIPQTSLTYPSAFEVKSLRELAKANGAGAVFASTEMPPSLLREWSQRLGMPVLTLDPVGTSARTGRSTYLDLLRYNLDQLKQGISLATGPPPAATAPAPLGAVRDAGLHRPAEGASPARPVRPIDRARELRPTPPGVPGPPDVVARPPVPVAPNDARPREGQPYDPIGLPLPPVPATQPHSPFKPIPKSEP